jgi:hypothetical protein
LWVFKFFNFGSVFEFRLLEEKEERKMGVKEEKEGRKKKGRIY